MSKNNRFVRNPSLSSSQFRVTPAKVNASPIAKLSIAQQLLAKFESKYTSSVKVKANKAEISEPIQKIETTLADVKDDKQRDELAVSYESDFESSVSNSSEDDITSYVINDVRGSKLNDLTSVNVTRRSKTPTHEDLGSFSSENKDEKPSLEESIHEHIFTFEELFEKDVDLIGKNTNQITKDNEYSTDTKPLYADIVEIEKDIPSNRSEDHSFFESEIEDEHISVDKDSSPESIFTFQELVNRNANAFTKAYNEDYKTVGDLISDSKSLVTEAIECIESESRVSTVYDTNNPVQTPVPVPEPQLEIVNEELLELAKKPSSPSKVRADSTQEIPTKVQEPEMKVNAKRKTRQQSLDERRRLERMFLLLENEATAPGEIEQPLFSPLVLAWGGEKVTEAEIPYDPCFASPEEMFTEMLRMRLRVTRDKMAAEYAAYRTCCEATCRLASSHRPVTLARTQQIISQLKSSEHLEPDR